MADVVDTATRSRMMAGIRSKNTKPETIIRRGLHAKGFRYTLHSKGMPGKPDIVMPKWHVVIFVHGCFWHQHGCHLSRTPQTNTEFWHAKLLGNRRRDEYVKSQLSQTGWRIATVWECATKGSNAINQLPDLLERPAKWIRDPFESSTIEFTASDLLTFAQPAVDFYIKT